MRRAFLAAVALAMAFALVDACGGQSGEPGAPASAYQAGGFGGVVDARAPVDVVVAPIVTLGARVRDLTTAAPIPNVLVVVEVGGLDQPNPAGVAADGGLVSTVAWNPFYQYSALTNDAGAIDLSVRGGEVGLHAFADGYLEGTAGPSGAGPDAAIVPLRSLAELPEAGVPLRPKVSGLTASPPFVAPGAPILFTVTVDSPSLGSLSEQVLLALPITHEAWALAAPMPAVPGGAYPSGTYSRIVAAPATPGTYTYDFVAAALGGAVSDRVSIAVTVTPGGKPPMVDSGAPDGAFSLDGGGLPDGRH